MRGRPAASALVACLILSCAATARAEKDVSGAVLSPLLAGRTVYGPGSVEAVLGQLPELTSLGQIERIMALSASDPAARTLAAAAADPALLEGRLAEIKARVGADKVPALTAAVLNLHIQALGDEAFMARLRSIAAEAPPGLAPDRGGWFDGAAARTPSAEVEPALVWRARPDSDDKRRVHTLSYDGGRLLINGSVARDLRDVSVKDGAAKETFVHPADPGLLVSIYHSRGSMEGFLRKSARLESLAPLSSAGAAPRLIEHGEASVPGMGRVYFYVHELIEGARLADMPRANWPLEQVDRLFDRIEKAGLALNIPGPGAAWLLSHVMIGKTASGGERAYLLGGTVRRAQPEASAERSEMLRAMVRTEETAAAPDAFRPGARGKGLYGALSLLPVSSERDALLARIPGRVFSGLESLDIASVLSLAGPRIDYSLIAPEAWSWMRREDAERLIERLTLSDKRGAAEVGRSWLRAHQRDSSRSQELTALLGRPDSVLFRAIPDELLKPIPEGEARDSAILGIPASSFYDMESAQVVAVLALARSRSAVYAKIPAEAWRRLRLRDVLWLQKHLSDNDAAEAVWRLWMSVRESRPGEAKKTGEELMAVLRTSNGKAWQEALLAMPPAAFAELGSGAVKDILCLFYRFSDDNYPQAALSLLRKLPEEAWTALTPADMERVSEAFHPPYVHPNYQLWQRERLEILSRIQTFWQEANR